MKTRIAAFCALLIAGSALADPYTIAKSQAKRASSQNDAEQSRIANAANGAAPAQPAPAAPAATPANPALQATLNNINSLQANFAVLNNAAADTPDPDQKISLLNNLSSAAQGTKPASTSVKTLADDLVAAVAGRKKLNAAQQTTLARDVHAIFNSAHLSAAQQQALYDGVQKILTDGGASVDDAVNVVTDLKKISAETQ
jgi:hypothetical protein